MYWSKIKDECEEWGHNHEYKICSLETHDGTHKNSLGTNIRAQIGALGTNLISDWVYKWIVMSRVVHSF